MKNETKNISKSLKPSDKFTSYVASSGSLST